MFELIVKNNVFFCIYNLIKKLCCDYKDEREKDREREIIICIFI